jgi:hypothetical protein
MCVVSADANTAARAALQVQRALRKDYDLMTSDCRARCGAARIGMKSNFMNTAFLLMAQYGGKAIVPIEDVCRDYFSHLNPTKLIQKISLGDIAIPLVRMESSQKCAKGVHLLDLAKYLDARVDAARKEMVALTT